MVNLIAPRSAERRAVQKQLEGKVSDLADRLSRMLQVSVERSLGEVEHRADYGGVALLEVALLTVGGATAVGALGAADFATVLAGSTATVGFWIFAVPVSTFSWPVFATFAAGATSLALASGKFRGFAADRMRKRFVSASDTWLRAAILEPGPEGSPAIAPHLLSEIDRIARQRLEMI